MAVRAPVKVGAKDEGSYEAVVVVMHDGAREAGVVGGDGHAAADLLEQAHHDLAVENDVALEQEDVLVAVSAGVPQRANVVGRIEQRGMYIHDVDPGEVVPYPPSDLVRFVDRKSV